VIMEYLGAIFGIIIHEKKIAQIPSQTKHIAGRSYGMGTNGVL